MLYHRRGTYELLSMDEGATSTSHAHGAHGSHAAAHADETSGSSTTGERQRKYSKRYHRGERQSFRGERERSTPVSPTIDENTTNESPSRISQKYSTSTAPPTVYPQASGVPARSRVYINPYPVGGADSVHGFDYEYNYDNEDEDEDSLPPIDKEPENSGRMCRLNSSTSGLIADEQERDEEDEELNELEQYELDDRLGEMMPFAFGRRNRREGLFGASMAASIQSGGSWDAAEFIPLGDPNRSTLNDYSNDNKSQNSDEELPPQDKGIRKYAKLILPHVGLVFLTCAYTLIGASIFYSVENPNEMATKRKQLNMIYRRQEEFISALVELASTLVHNNNNNNNNSSRIDTGIITSNNSLLTSPNKQMMEIVYPNRSEWAALADRHMEDMSDQLFLAFEKYFLTSTEVKRNTTIEIWTFSTAVFFSVTVVTTIGYGNPVPITQFGRMMCISFSLFGIPLTLVTIADLGKFLSEHLIWVYSKYLRFKHYLFRRILNAQIRRKNRQQQQQNKNLNGNLLSQREHVCNECHSRGISDHMQVIEEQKIPALLVLGILVLYTALGGVLMSQLEPWSFFTSFYWSFITMTTVGFGDLMPRRDEYMYLTLLYIVLGLAITTMCIDLVGVQYIRKIHYFGRKIQDARSALAVVGGKVVLVSELYANLMQRRARSSAREAFIIENLYVSKHIIPFIPSDIRLIKYIDQQPVDNFHNHRASLSQSLSSLDPLSSCRFCHSRFSISQHT